MTDYNGELPPIPHNKLTKTPNKLSMTYNNGELPPIPHHKLSKTPNKLSMTYNNGELPPIPHHKLSKTPNKLSMTYNNGELPPIPHHKLSKTPNKLSMTYNNGELPLPPIPHHKLSKTPNKLSMTYNNGELPLPPIPKNNTIRSRSTKPLSKITYDVMAYYNYFMKKYKAHYKMFYQYGTTDEELDKIVTQRINYIYKKLLMGDDIMFYNSSLSISDDEKSEYVRYNLKKALEFKSNASSFPKKQNLIIYHGEPLSEIKIVPDNCVIIILTPLGRLSRQSETKYKTYISGIQSYEKYKEFLENPMCYKRNELRGFYSDSSIYFPGQQYLDMRLCYFYDYDKNNLMQIYKGVYTCDFTNLINGPSYTPNFNSSNTVETKLSNLIAKLEGLIFVNCCRDLNLYLISKKLDIETTMAMKQYETLISILNRSVYFLRQNNENELEEDYKGFYNCNAIIDFDKQSSKCAKSIYVYKSKFNNVSKQKYNLLKKLQPKLKEVSRIATNANSYTQCENLRIYYKYFEPIINWLNQNNPETAKMDSIFNELDNLNIDNNVLEDILWHYEIKQSDSLLYIVIKILYSYYIFRNINKNYDFKLYAYSDLYLNGLKIDYVLLYKLIEKNILEIFKNIYLRNNNITVIFQYIIDKLVEIIKSNSDEPAIYFEGNPFNFSIKEVTPIVGLFRFSSKKIKCITSEYFNSNKDDIPLLFRIHIAELIIVYSKYNLGKKEFTKPLLNSRESETTLGGYRKINTKHKLYKTSSNNKRSKHKSLKIKNKTKTKIQKRI
jgi:mRNA-degrading endonuclease YafQ of YafQ-DinJ toxin-antitoxin module